jgi:hypothetical protein
MKSVEKVRGVLIATFRHALHRTRYLVANIDGGNDIIEQLVGSRGDDVLAEIVDCAMLQLGHVSATDVLDPNSPTKRAVRGGFKRQAERKVNARSEVANAE